MVQNTLLLRTLTERSILKFGDHPHVMVKEAIETGNASELVWAYYNLSKITYTNDVLKALGIGPNEQISKPGTNPELGEKVLKRFEIKNLEFQLRRNKQRFIDRFSSTKAIKRINRSLHAESTDGD